MFVDLNWQKMCNRESLRFSLPKEKKLVQTYLYELKAQEKDSATRTGFNVPDVIYLITPTGLSMVNPNNDWVAGMKEKPNRQQRWKTWRYIRELSIRSIICRKWDLRLSGLIRARK
ncbi:MAG: hypothetical protein IPF54_20465 [Draconibacterium sp.]|nr:hypothetical protein [Draconibacterium sp.]